MKRIYLNQPLALGSHLTLPENVQHRLFRVMRMGVGDTFEIFNGMGEAAMADITDAKCRQAHITTMLAAKPPLPPLVLAVGLLKRDAWETVLRQATEMGVTTLIPLKTRFTQVSKFNTERAHLIMVEAAEQCERTSLPNLLPVQTLEAYINTLQQPCLWAYERLAEDPCTPHTSGHAHTLLVGPEGGFAPDELTLLTTHPLVRPFSLGPTILRADTAVVAGLAMVQSLTQPPFSNA